MKRALISVSKKTPRVANFANELESLGWEILSTGGTAEFLKSHGVKVKLVENITGFPSIMDGRVKTLHPAIFAGILFDRSKSEHKRDLEKVNALPVDLVFVSFYPFEEVVKSHDATLDEIIENIDIGGPSLVRASAKNFKFVTVLVDEDDIPEVLEEIKRNGEVSAETRERLAVKAFATTAVYDSIVYNTLWGLFMDHGIPEYFINAAKLELPLRYGENPHQKAALYRNIQTGYILDKIEKIWGKDLSYNNLVDFFAGYSLIQEFNDPTAVILKHTNPCGVASRANIFDAYVEALDADPVSAFGGIVILNREVDEELAEKLNEHFLEIVAAPSFTGASLEILKKKKNRRIIKYLEVDEENIEFRSVPGGVLLQERDKILLEREKLEAVTGETDNRTLEELLFAFKVVKHVKSNAIVVAKNLKTIGIGAGQMNRVQAVEIALKNAGDEARDAVLASDAFFPFPDSIELAAKAGIRAIIQPGGSVRDAEVIEAAKKHGITMIFTHMRHFKH